MTNQQQDETPVRIISSCSICNCITVELRQTSTFGDSAVAWCENGHVTIYSPYLPEQGRLVFNFDDL